MINSRDGPVATAVAAEDTVAGAASQAGVGAAPAPPAAGAAPPRDVPYIWSRILFAYSSPSASRRSR
eukprot:Skav200189  [mRNA]  locus=scaffold2383:170714:172151:- [translate_table: standard]